MDQQSLASRGFLPAPTWSVFLGQLGAGFVLGGAALFILAVVMMSLKRQSQGKWAFVAGCLCVLGAMGALLTLFLTDQFQFEYVYSHAWRDLSPQYKIAAVWSGQQGSFLLWACTSAIFGFLAVWRTGPYQRWFVITYSVFLGCLCCILAYETPFALIQQLVAHGVQYTPPDGQGLTPSLQNYWVVVHPPTIFMGFGSLTVPFAFAVSAMLSRDATGWIARVRPWALVSLSILGLGLVMGGLWAYETQGWGGFWAWDPVENVSFVPWIFVAAFVHGMIVQTTRKRWHGTNFLMGGLPFLLFVYGTFLTRSGFLNQFSNHSFAEMNRSALWILLGFMTIVSALFVFLWATIGRKLGKDSDAILQNEGFNREKAYESGVILLSGLATTIAAGMSVPFFLGLLGSTAKVVEEPLYHSVVVWFFAPIMVLMASAPFLSWRAMPAKQFWQRVINVIGVTIGLLGILMMILKFSDFPVHSHDLPPISFPFHVFVPRFTWVMCLFALSAFALVANIWRLAEMFPKSKTGVGGFVAHLGVATVMSGLILSRGLEQREQLYVAEGSPGTALGYTIAYKDMTSNPEHDRNNKVEFTVSTLGGSQGSFTARLGFFFMPVEEGQESQIPKAFTWPHIQREATHDVYLSLGDPQFTLWQKPTGMAVGKTVVEQMANETNLGVTYLEATQHGTPGEEGASFGAKVRVVENGKSYDSEPTIKVGAGPELVRASPSFYAYVDRIDAKDRTIQLQLAYVHPVFPIELFYKPMTMLVWIGTGILTLGGLLSAFYRRNKRVPPVAKKPATVNVEVKEDAVVPTA